MDNIETKQHVDDLPNLSRGEVQQLIDARIAYMIEVEEQEKINAAATEADAKRLGKMSLLQRICNCFTRKAVSS